MSFTAAHRKAFRQDLRVQEAAHLAADPAVALIQTLLAVNGPMALRQVRPVNMDGDDDLHALGTRLLPP